MRDRKSIRTAVLSVLKSISALKSAKPGLRRLGLGAGLACVVALSGCASYRPTQSGYLSDYTQLQRDPIHLNYGLGVQRANAHNATPQATSQIDSYYIETVEWKVDEKSRAGGNPDRQAFLTSTLDRALRKQLGKLKPIVDQPGPGSARVRAVITDVQLSRPYLNAALIPMNLALTMTFWTPVAIGPIFNGGGFVEAEVLGPDGKQISAVSCASAGGPLDVVGYYSRTRHARQAMQRAAWELRETLEH
jgi:Protein of unknown function (DUF3313)